MLLLLLFVLVLNLAGHPLWHLLLASVNSHTFHHQSSY